MGSSSPQPVTTTQTTKTDPWGPQQPHLEKVFKEAEGIYNQGPNTMYGGAFTAPTDPATTTGINRLETRGLSGSPVLNAGATELTKTLNGGYIDPMGNPGFQSVVDTTKANTLPGIDSRFMGAGRSGSGLHGRAVGEGLGSAIGGLTYGAYNDERNRMANAVNAAPQYAAADYNDIGAVAAAGAAREGIAQNNINELIARHDFAQNADSDALARYRAMVEGNYGGTSTGTSTQYLPQQNIWSSLLGGLASGTGILGATGAFGKTGWMFSDERLKENIEPVGETFDGLPIYTYEYKWGGPPQMGVMAQDVAKVKPEAVAMTPSGYYAVNYEAL